MRSRLINTWCFFLLTVMGLSAQKPFAEDYDGIASVVQLDSMIITAQKQGFDVAEFIDILREDQSFYQSFKHLHFFNYTASHRMAFFSKKGTPETTYLVTTQQFMLNDSCRRMNFIHPPEIEGRFYRREDDNRYTTANLYEKVFFTDGTACERTHSTAAEPRGLQRYYEALKTFIFQPGEQVDVPLVSKKTALFDSDLMPYYDYKISRGLYQGTIDSYIFTIEVKDQFRDQKEGKTLVKSLQTYFRVSDFQVLGRNYRIENSGLASCEVEMEVELVFVEGVYLPGRVAYQGTWNIPGKRRETGEFEAIFSNYSR